MGIGAITINGHYQQSATGKLLMEFTPTETDKFIVNGSAAIEPGASLSLQALPNFYPTGYYQFITDAMLFDNSAVTMAAFGDNRNLLSDSPTLIMSLANTPAGSAVNIARPPNAYSRHASSATGTSVGKALVGVAAQATGDMRNLFAAIDFSRSGGAGVRSALRQLAPTAYDNTAKASLQAGHALSGLLLDQLAAAGAPASASDVRGLSSGSPEATDSAFILPFGGYFGQNAQGDNQGFDASFAGIIAGVNRRFDKGLAGLHTALLHRETNNRSDASARSQANGILLGIHGSLFPHEGFFINGLASAGLENTHMTRNVEIDAYHRKSHSEYTAVTAQSALRTGYEWQAGDVRFGPLAGLDYAFYYRPSVSETGGQATRLQADAAGFHSLRAALGGQVRAQTRLTDNLTLRAGLSAQWLHEMLDTRYGSTASFVGYGRNDFSVKNRTDDRDALALNASISLITDGALSLNAYVGAELFRSRSNSVQGGLSLCVRF